MIGVAILLKFDLSDDWIGFWGSLIGSLLGIVGVYATMRLDQIKREAERKQDLFVSNISVYTELVNTLKIQELNLLLNKLLELKSSEKWYGLNRTTKLMIEKIVSESRNKTEYDGLRNVVRTYIINELRTEFTVKFLNRTYILEDGKILTLDDEDIEFTAVDQLVELLIPRLVNNINYMDDDEMEYVLNSYEQFRRDFSSRENLNNFSKHADIIYETLLKLPSSTIWKIFVTERGLLFREINEFKKEIEIKIENLYE
ncbi:hypothetical protein ABKJ26_03100 [Exiguobacterium mexicanum]